jgi:hypothetical protein
MEFTGVVRHLAQFAAGWLVSKGYIDGSMQETLVGVLVGLATLGWYWNEKKA